MCTATSCLFILYLFNDTLNTFYLRLYGERRNPLPLQGLLFPISSKDCFICIIPHQDNTYHGLCYTSHGALAGTRNSSMGPPRRIVPMTHCIMSEHSYHGATSRSRTATNNKKLQDIFRIFNNIKCHESIEYHPTGFKKVNGRIISLKIYTGHRTKM